MPRATLRMELGRNSRDYAAVLDRPKLKGVKVRAVGRGNSIEMDIEAEDSRALVSAVGIIIKQLRTVESVGSLVDNRVKKGQR